MTECVKIRCDDCKFHEECVDYGWQDCKKFTPKPSEPMTKLCDTCEYLKFCARSGIEDVGCDRYKKDTTTNEEWFCGLSTEEKARVLANEKLHFRMLDYDGFVEWLKQPHRNE